MNISIMNMHEYHQYEKSNRNSNALLGIYLVNGLLFTVATTQQQPIYGRG